MAAIFTDFNNTAHPVFDWAQQGLSEGSLYHRCFSRLDTGLPMAGNLF